MMNTVSPICLLVGAQISKEGDESIRTRKVCISFQKKLVKQMHFCLANRISKFGVKIRNKLVRS